MSVIVAAVGDMAELFKATAELAVEKIILISHPENEKLTEKTKKDAEGLKIPVDVVETKGDVWEETFKIIHGIKASNGKHDILVNVSTGDNMTNCAMTSAAFVNGLKAFSVTNGEISLLPILKFSYYKLITDRKMKILEVLHNEPNCCASMEELSKKCNMSLPLVSYHINGNPKSEGLKEMALVETIPMGGKIEVMLSLLGKMLMKGYVD